MTRVLLGIVALNVLGTFAVACDGYCHGYFEEYPPAYGYYELPPGPGWEYTPVYYAEPVPQFGYPPVPFSARPYAGAPATHGQQPALRADSIGSSMPSFGQPRDDRRFSQFDQSQVDRSRFGQSQFGGRASQDGRFPGNGLGQSQGFPSGAGGGFGSPGGQFGGGGGGSFNRSPGGSMGGGGAPQIASPGRVSPGRYNLQTPR